MARFYVLLSVIFTFVGMVLPKEDGGLTQKQSILQNVGENAQGAVGQQSIASKNTEPPKLGNEEVLETKEQQNAASNSIPAKDDMPSFRMKKFNLLWQKASKQLSASKLQGLKAELDVLDKEEIALKHLKSVNQDKDGLLEARLIRKVNDLVKKYDLVNYNPVTAENLKENQKWETYNNLDQRIFKDKKLNKLWLKSLQAGLSEEELSLLQEEYQHVQDKIDLLEATADQSSQQGKQNANSIEEETAESSSQEKLKSANMREQMLDLKIDYKRLEALSEAYSRQASFSEPQVAQLWQMAVEAKFSPVELDSIKTELKHYEQRLHKLQSLQKQSVHGEHSKEKNKFLDLEKPDEEYLNRKLEKTQHYLSKLQMDLESRIRHRMEL